MKDFKIPGFVYSLALAILAWAIQYLTQYGGGVPWAPIALAVIPMLIKVIEVQVKPPATALPTIRGLDDMSPTPSKLTRFLLG